MKLWVNRGRYPVCPGELWCIPALDITRHYLQTLRNFRKLSERTNFAAMLPAPWLNHFFHLLDKKRKWKWIWDQAATTDDSQSNWAYITGHCSLKDILSVGIVDQMTVKKFRVILATRARMLRPYWRHMRCIADTTYGDYRPHMSPQRLNSKSKNTVSKVKIISRTAESKNSRLFYYFPFRPGCMREFTQGKQERPRICPLPGIYFRGVTPFSLGRLYDGCRFW